MSKVLYLCLFFSVFYAHSQTIKQISHYKILTEKQAYLGHLKVTQTQHKDFLEIEVVSESKIKVFISIDLKYILHEIYDHGVLLSSRIQTYVNGHLHSSSIVTKQHNKYQIKLSGKEFIFDSLIRYSGGLLYFQEPTNIKQVFSEFHGILKPIQAKSLHQYLITNPLNKKVNSYLYKKGLLQRIIINHRIMTVIIEKID